MGLYFIAAGRATRNREKSLERSFSLQELIQFLPPECVARLRSYFPAGTGIYLWGANPGRSFNELSRAESGCLAVDVRNDQVVQVFEYCFYVRTNGVHLQEHVGWDAEKPRDERRPYEYVFFLKDPRGTSRTSKRFFQRAFALESNDNWLVGQRHFDDAAVALAMGRAGCRTVEEFLGLVPAKFPHAGSSPAMLRPSVKLPDAGEVKEPEPAKPALILAPGWLAPVVALVAALKADRNHQERDHEELVSSLFVALGYQLITEIKFRHGRIDIGIYKDAHPLVVIEAKRDWALSRESRDYLSQAYGYAQEVGARHVIITNGDTYCVYDRDRGRSYADNLVGEACLTTLTESGLKVIESLRKGILG